jgi:MoxR-like ATPase
MRFQGTSAYVATEDLKVAVNAAIALERPLLVKGEPGTGKTVLALEIAKSLAAPLLEWHVKSTTKALQGLYEYDAVSRLRDSQLGDARGNDIRNYIRRGRLWEAFTAEERPVLLIDEIDKADIEFPNDLLLELDRMEFYVYETGETVKARRRPIVVVTSNNEKELPDAFLRRCFFHYVRFPDPDTMRAIIEVHFPRHQAAPGRRSAQAVLRDSRRARHEEEAIDLGAARLAQALDGRGHRPRNAARARSQEADSAAARRPHQERAGRPPVRAPRLHGTARGPLTDW